jgi:hypothetical protein
MRIGGLIDRVGKTPEFVRLESALAQTRIDLEREVGPARLPTGLCGQPIDPLRNDVTGQPGDRRVLAAQKYLKLAEDYLGVRNLHSGWDSLQSAQRELLARDFDKVQRAAVVLRREADKIGGWRSKAIIDLLDKAKGSDPNKPHDADWLLDALALRDEYFRTTYFRIALRRRHLSRVLLGLAAILAFFLALCWWGIVDEQILDKPALVTAVVIFGILGACVSVSQGLLWSDVSAKIPAQQLGAFTVWMRPAIGAAAALAALVLLRAGIIGFIHAEKPAVVLAIAFTAGYSERFIVGAVDRFGKSGGS